MRRVSHKRSGIESAVLAARVVDRGGTSTASNKPERRGSRMRSGISHAAALPAENQKTGRQVERQIHSQVKMVKISVRIEAGIMQIALSTLLLLHRVACAKPIDFRVK